MPLKSVFVGSWSYLMPDTEPNPNGRIVLIKKRSFGPLETYDWGIDVNGLPYEEYQWCENDLFENENYFKHISKKEQSRRTYLRAIIRTNVPSACIFNFQGSRRSS